MNVLRALGTRVDGLHATIALFNAILIVIMWYVVFGLLRVERQETIRAAMDRNDNLAIALEQYTIRTIESADAVIQHLADKYAQSGGKMDLAEFGANLVVDKRAIIGVVLADERGDAIPTAYSRNPTSRWNVADREEFRVHAAHDGGRIFVGKPVVDRFTGQWVIPVTRRINKPDGTFGGVAMALIEPARFTDVLHDAKLRPLDIMSLVGLDGITRARLRGTATSWGEDISESPLLAEQARHPVGSYFARGQVDGTPRFFSYRTLPHYPVVAIIGTAEADVMAEYHRSRTRYFWAAGVISSVIAGFAVLMMLALASQRRATVALGTANRSLRESEARLRCLTAMSSDFYWETDAEHRLLTRSSANEARGTGSPFRRAPHVGERRWEVPYLSPDEAGWQAHRAVVDAHRPFRHFEVSRPGPDGSARHILLSGDPVFDDSGAFTGYRGVGVDISERKAAEARVAYLNRIYAMLSGTNALIARALDRDELFTEACRIAVAAGGLRMAWIAIVDPIEKKFVPVASAGADAQYMTALKEGLSSSEGTVAGNTAAARAVRERKFVVFTDLPDNPAVMFGKEYATAGIGSMAVLPLMVAGEPVGVLALFASERDFFHDSEMKGLTELANDISFGIDHLDKRERLDYLAYYDQLTGLANRSLFLERVAQFMRAAAGKGHRLALFLIDVERFKNINDSLGRPAGDEILMQVGTWLTSRAGDASLLGRLGADHFAAVMPEVRQEGNLAHLVESTLESFAGHPFHHGDSVFRLAAKVGVGVFPDDGADADTLFKNAEAALKMAKASGARYLFHTRAMTDMTAGKLTLESQLRQALDNEEFVLHYQPKVNLVSGRLTGAEALIRWNDPRTGLVPPGRFIPILEETGLIHDVGRWALKKAIADYLRWRDTGLAAVRIAVNVSPLELHDRGYIAEIGQAIGIDPQAAAGLELEITESLIMEDVRHSISCLNAIRAMGVTIAIDDFGTGFSSLSYLARLPVDTLKIDRTFISDMTTGPQGLSLVSTIINLARSLKLKVVAEGVETEEQSRLLRLLSCDEMQGFLFSKAVPVGDFEERFLAPIPAA